VFTRSKTNKNTWQTILVYMLERLT